MYFSRLEVVADAGMAAEAAQLAADVEVSDVAGLAALLERLAAQHASAPFSKATLEALGAQYGSALGELVRARTAAAWGVGRMFAEEHRGWMLVGARAIKFSPWLEARDRIAGRAALPLATRIDRLCERAGDTELDDDDEDFAPRLYPLQHGQGYFDAGVTRDGQQVLMAAFHPMTFAILFAADGECIEYLARPNSTSAPDEAALKRWQAELGFTPRTIHVQRFLFEDVGLGIEDLPGYLEEFLDDPDAEDAEEQAERFRAIREWLDEGSFVLYWGNDLWLDGTGEVTSS
jgi:hypothetical protein